jgi:hypothetical protein
MNPNRKRWNEQHQSLQKALQAANYEAARGLFYVLHAQVHSAKMSGLGEWSFEDEILDDLDESGFRRIPSGAEHSIAWNIWHLARIEDVTMNLLVAGTAQLYFAQGWFEQMKIPFRHAGNAMSAAEMERLGAEIDIEALRSYRVAVGRRTREIVSALDETEYRLRVDASRLERVREQGAVPESAGEVIEYWGKRTIAGLLLMPATRHNILHLNECLRLKDSK